MRIPLIMALALSVWVTPLPQARAATPPGADTLQDTIARLDAEVFGAFNACVDPAQLQRHAAFFARDVEFAHIQRNVQEPPAPARCCTILRACIFDWPPCLRLPDRDYRSA